MDRRHGAPLLRRLVARGVQHVLKDRADGDRHGLSIVLHLAPNAANPECGLVAELAHEEGVQLRVERLSLLAPVHPERACRRLISGDSSVDSNTHG
jgi:hypothetical protein